MLTQRLMRLSSNSGIISQLLYQRQNAGILVNNRSLFGFLNSVFNKVDPNRIEQVGPDRAAAEWLIRCGAGVKWTQSETWLKDYNSLPSEGDSHRYKIAEIDGTDSAMMHIGFPHLKGLKHLTKFIIKNNGYIDDQAITMLSYVKDTLLHLEIWSCIGVTDEGIKSLTQLEKLKYLKLFDLPNVLHKEECLQILNESLKGCEIEWPIAKKKR